MRKVIYVVYYTTSLGVMLAETFYTFGSAADRALEVRAEGCTQIAVTRERPSGATETVIELKEAR